MPKAFLSVVHRLITTDTAARGRSLGKSQASSSAACISGLPRMSIKEMFIAECEGISYLRAVDEIEGRPVRPALELAEAQRKSS